jgi:exodeoxyribonuclease VIII
MLSENGIYKNLSFEQYLAEERMNNSGIKKILKSPMHYKANLEIERKETQALLVGTATHSHVLEPDSTYTDLTLANGSDPENETTLKNAALLEIANPGANYVVAPEDLDKRTKKGKETWERLAATGKKILRYKDWQIVDGITTAIRAHESASRLLSQGTPELTVFTELDGVPVKVRADWHRPGILIDLKTTDDASPDGFSRAVFKYGYDIQNALYLDAFAAAGIDVHTFIFIAVEKTAPFCCSILELDPDSIEHGRRQYQKGLATYKACSETNEWPGYSPNITMISLPAWALRDL